MRAVDGTRDVIMALSGLTEISLVGPPSGAKQAPFSQLRGAISNVRGFAREWRARQDSNL